MEQPLWIGGPPAAGKTAVAVSLARRHGLRWYGSDTRTWEHRDRALANGSDAAQRFESLSPEERWSKPPSELVAMSLHRERLQMILDDVRALPERPLVVAEGTPITPTGVATGAIDANRALWLIPTRELQERRLLANGVGAGQARLYQALRDLVEQEAEEQRAPVLRLDGIVGVEGVVAEVEARFAEALAVGPGAATLEERQVLLRESNLSIVGQVRGYFARPWANGDANLSVLEFVCECGDPRCTETVRLTVDAAAGAPVTAHASR